MSFAIASESIFQDRRLSGADLRVLLAILSHTRPNKPYCWPSRARLAECIGIKSHSRISEILARLVALGWLSIKRTGRSSLYTVHAPCPTSDVHPVVDIEETSEYLEERTPYPPAVSVAVTEIQTPDTQTLNQGDSPAAVVVVEQTNTGIAVADSRDSGFPTEPETVEPSDNSEEGGQGEDSATSNHREAVEPPESVPAPATASKAKVDPEERQKAIQTVLERFEQVSGIRYQGRATERKIGRRIERYGLALVLAVIGAKAADFQHPLVLLRPSVLESVAAELERDRQQRQQAIERDQAALDELRRPTGKRTEEGAKRGIQALKAALGMRPKPDTPA